MVEQILAAPLVDHSLLQVTTIKRQLMNMVSSLHLLFHFSDIGKASYYLKLLVLDNSWIFSSYDL